MRGTCASSPIELDVEILLRLAPQRALRLPLPLLIQDARQPLATADVLPGFWDITAEQLVGGNNERPALPRLLHGIRVAPVMALDAHDQRIRPELGDRHGRKASEAVAELLPVVICQ